MGIKIRRVVLMVMLIWLSLCLEMCCCSNEDAKENTQPWTDWVSHKLAEGLGGIRLDSQKKSSEKDVVGRVEDAATKATETVNSAVSGASKYASVKAREAASEAKEFGLDKAKSAYSGAKRRINLAKNEASGNTSGEYDPREMIGPGMDYGRDNTTASTKRSRHRHHHHHNHHHKKRGETRDQNRNCHYQAPPPLPEGIAKDNYGRAQRKLKESLGLAEETASENAESEYEAAKENLSQATGDLGDTIRDSDIEEL